MAFDLDKDRRNRAKHGISLARWVDMTMWAVLHDDRVGYGEERYRAFGEIDGHPHCLVCKTKPANPIWKKADFERAKRPEHVLPPEVLAQFPKHRGPQKAPTKIPISIRLSSDVLGHFKRKGKGWQTRIDDALRKVAGLKER
jgi:uncharacterized protein (DUF4415 family)